VSAQRPPFNKLYDSPKGGNPALNNQDLVDIIAYLRTLRK